MSLQVVGGGVDCDPTTPSRCIFSFQNVKTYTGETDRHVLRIRDRRPRVGRLVPRRCDRALQRVGERLR